MQQDTYDPFTHLLNALPGEKTPLLAGGQGTPYDRSLHHLLDVLLNSLGGL